jgi:hypothetical protein
MPLALDAKKWYHFKGQAVKGQFDCI